MQHLKEIQAKGFYAFCGKPSANSSFIESKKEAREFINSANGRFAGFLRIREYLISQDSWTLLCEIEDEETIINAYLAKREESTCEYKLPPLSEIWRIVSEQVRNFLSRFVKFCNHERGRTGSLVHSNYDRYFFENEEAALMFIKKIYEQSLDFSQWNRKYKPNSKYFYFTNKEKRSNVFLCSNNLKGLSLLLIGVVGSVVTTRLTNHILRKLITSTKILHSHSKNTYNQVQKE